MAATPQKPNINEADTPHVEEKVPVPKNLFLNFFVQFLIIGVVFFVLGLAVGQKKVQIEKKNFAPKITISNQTPPANQNIDFSLMWNVLNTIPQKYLDKNSIDGQKLMYGAISGMVRSLGDPYTAFLDPKQNESVKEELAGSYEGIGIQIGFNEDKRLVVIAPLSGTPAQAAGLKAKDLILKIDGKDTFDLTLPEAVDLIRGQAHTKVKLTLQHLAETKPFDIEIERAQITVKSVELTENGNVAVFKVSRFGDTTDKEWDEAVSVALSKNPRAVIVDMRNNPGGLLSSSIHLASEFVRGTVVKQQFADGRIDSLATDHEGRLLKIPTVVLVNNGSASASEIFAGAIQDDRRGKIVGEKSFGKGTVQDVVDFPGGSGLHITIAKWLTPKGSSIHGVGITPDIVLESKTEDLKQNKDPQMDKALELLK